MIALITTGGIILGTLTVIFLPSNKRKIALVALLNETAYFAPTNSAIFSSNSVTFLSCKKFE